MINKNKLYRYDISQSALYKCRSKNKLSEFLKISIKDVDKIIKYYTFNIPKKDTSKTRQISAPQKKLKTLQKRLLYLIKRIKLQKKIYDNFSKIKDYEKMTVYDKEIIKSINTLKGQLQAAKNINYNVFPEITRIVYSINCKTNKKPLGNS